MPDNQLQAQTTALRQAVDQAKVRVCGGRGGGEVGRGWEAGSGLGEGAGRRGGREVRGCGIEGLGRQAVDEAKVKGQSIG